MKDLKPTCRVAVIQAAPLLFRKDACVEKAVSLILEAALHAQTAPIRDAEEKYVRLLASHVRQGS